MMHMFHYICIYVRVPICIYIHTVHAMFRLCELADSDMLDQSYGMLILCMECVHRAKCI